MDRQFTWPGWEVEKLLGEGSFGKVYKIQRKEFGQTYEAALKVISVPATEEEVKSAYEEGMDDESVTTYYASLVQDIVSEFAMMSQLKGNSNIVSYEDHMVLERENSIGWDILIRMELLEGLTEYSRNHPLKESDVIRLGIHMARALEICQKRNIIHRDIKPENIFVSQDGNYKLGDFGIARVAEKNISAMSKKGTYNYMAPEVYLGKEYGSTVDIYSVGVVMYRFLNDNRIPFLPPFPQAIKYTDRERALEMRMSGAEMPAPKMGSDELKRIVLKACAYRMEDRFATPKELRLALEKLRREDELVNTVGVELTEESKTDLDATVRMAEFESTSVARENEVDLDATVHMAEPEPTSVANAFEEDLDATVHMAEPESIVKKKAELTPSVTEKMAEEKVSAEEQKPKVKKKKAVALVTAAIGIIAAVTVGIVIVLINSNNSNNTVKEPSDQQIVVASQPENNKPYVEQPKPQITETVYTLDNIAEWEMGCTVSLGKYNKKSLEWVVLQNNSHYSILLCKYVIDKKQYNEKYGYITWNDCSLRKWLNNSFVNMAFSGEESKALAVYGDFHKYTYMENISSQPIAKDKILLLPGDYALSLNESILKGTDPDGNDAAWWLRTEGGSSDCVQSVAADGSVNKMGTMANKELGIRPMIVIKHE